MRAVAVLRGVTKSYAGVMHRVQAVRDVDLTLYAGEIVGLVGPNGSGKTTLLRLLVGLLRPDRGSIRVFERPISDLETQRRIGYVPENPAFPPGIRLRTFLRYQMQLLRLNGNAGRQRVHRLCTEFELEGMDRQVISRFSRGMKQKVAFICAVLGEPSLLVLDEPISGMDPVAIARVRAHLDQHRARGGTALIASHLLDELVKVCDRVVFMRDGRLVREWRRPPTGAPHVHERTLTSLFMEIVRP